jgi:heme-degrading monooxygenase HmoA
MPRPEMIMTVRFASELPHDEAMAVMEERAPEFAALDGLVQKYYVQDTETGEYCGIYLWRSAADLAEYRESELRASIAAAYKAIGTPRVEVYRMIRPLRDTDPA